YLQRIHKVQDYIEENLNDNFVLSELADIAGFSKYHFHRIFSAITNETLLQYINRIKLERAAFLILHHPNTNMTDITYRFGFTDSAIFSRSFRSYYGVSPTEYRNQDSKNCKDPTETSQYTKSAINQNIGSDTMETKARSVEIISVDMRVIYLRYTGTYQGLAAAMPGMMERLYGFAMNNNLLEPGKTKILSAYHDNPENAEVQDKYWELFKNTEWNKSRTDRPQYSVLEAILVENPDFDNQDALTSEISERVMCVANDVKDYIKSIE
ncbi:AraC family transcriptional regulator, partial [Christensenellaceae bacterium OttesenSCG-928-M15]|nr:AraC family transcriptional regulator [Christensenellaceae bacterium OttesenSCG-928-M15]